MPKRIRILRDIAVEGRHLAAGTSSTEEDAIADALILRRDAVYVPAAAPRVQPNPLGPLARRLVMVGDSITAQGNYRSSASAMVVDGRTVTVTATAHSLFIGAEFFINGAGPEYDGVFECASRASSSEFTYQLPAFPKAAPVLTNTSIVVQARYQDRNWIQYANQALGNPLLQVRNVGGSGDRTDDILRRLHRDVLSIQPDVVSLMIGINDVIADRPDARIRENLMAIVSAIRDSGSLLIWHTLTPMNAAFANYTAARGQALLRSNAFIRQAAQRLPGVILIDAHAALCDPLSATGDFKSGLASDGLHMAGRGGQVLGKAAITALSGLFPRMPPRITSVQQNFVADPLSNQINGNPLMLVGAGGASSGSITATDTIPEGYTVSETGSGNVTVTTPARADGLGEDIRLVFVAVAANDEFNVVLTGATALASRVAAGDRLTAECNLKGESLTNISRIDWLLEITIDGTAYTISATANSATAGWLEDFDLWLRMPEFTLPPGNLTAVQMRLKVMCSGAGGATINYGVATIDKLIAP